MAANTKNDTDGPYPCVIQSPPRKSVEGNILHNFLQRWHSFYQYVILSLQQVVDLDIELGKLRPQNA